MITVAQLILDRRAAGQEIAEVFRDLPAPQMRIYWEELSPVCPSRMALPVPRRPVNGLNVEIGTPRLRCALQSPDGRGLAWIDSGGSGLAYGPCTLGLCPRAKDSK